MVRENREGKLVLKVPNLVMQRLYIEQVQLMLLPEPKIRDEGRQFAERVTVKGDIAPLCGFVQDKLLQVLKNRDYRWANELTSKTVDQLVEAIDLNIQSLWKWPEGEGCWSVCLPGEEGNGSSYAQSKGFGIMETIEPGEGFWVNCQ